MKRIIIVFIIIIAVSLLAGLGCWQLHRANQKALLIETHQRLQNQPPLTASQILQASDPHKLLYYPVRLQGIPLNEFPILLDNVIENGQAGYRLYTPLLIDDTQVILVERQWIPVGQSRAQLPEKIPPLNTKYIEGYLDFAYRNRFTSSVLESKQVHWPLRIQTLDVALLSQLLGKEVYPMLIVPHIAASKAFPIPPERHRAYAVQWFGLAAALAIISFIVFKRHHT